MLNVPIGRAYSLDRLRKHPAYSAAIRHAKQHAKASGELVYVYLLRDGSGYTLSTDYWDRGFSHIAIPAKGALWALERLV